MRHGFELNLTEKGSWKAVIAAGATTPKAIVGDRRLCWRRLTLPVCVVFPSVDTPAFI